MHLWRNKISDEKEIKRERKRRRIRDEREWSRVNKPKCLPLQSAGDSIYVTYDFAVRIHMRVRRAHHILFSSGEKMTGEKKSASLLCVVSCSCIQFRPRQ